MEAKWKNTSIDKGVAGQHADEGDICCWTEAEEYCGDEHDPCSGLGGGGIS